MSLLERARTGKKEHAVTATSTRASAPEIAVRRRVRLPRWSQQVLFLAGVLVIWSAAALFGLISPQALPGPWAVAAALVETIQTSGYWNAIFETIRAAALGLAAALVVGIPLGIVIGTYAVVEKSARIVVEFGRAFPVIAVLPVLLLILGATLPMKALVVFIACVFPMMIQAQYGAQSVSEAINESVRSYRIPRLLRFTKVALPAAMPSIMTGLRLMSTVAVLVAVSVEVLTPVAGIGHEIASAQVDANSAVAWVYILTAGAIGYGINRLSLFVESKVLAWRPPANLDE